MPATHDVSAQLYALSLHLGTRREELLRQWRQAVRADPELATSASLSRSALNDHMGYDVREILREWGHLQAVIARELNTYASSHPQFDPMAMQAAREILAGLCLEGMCESASGYVSLQQSEAASRVRDLETSLRALEALESERATSCCRSASAP